VNDCGGKRLSYAEGFEDATELCLHELKKAKDLDDAKQRIEKIIRLVRRGSLSG